jgi:hypothetical protein
MTSDPSAKFVRDLLKGLSQLNRDAAGAAARLGDLLGLDGASIINLRRYKIRVPGLKRPVPCFMTQGQFQTVKAVVELATLATRVETLITRLQSQVANCDPVTSIRTGLLLPVRAAPIKKARTSTECGSQLGCCIPADGPEFCCSRQFCFGHAHGVKFNQGPCPCGGLRARAAKA